MKKVRFKKGDLLISNTWRDLTFVPTLTVLRVDQSTAAVELEASPEAKVAYKIKGKTILVGASGLMLFSEWEKKMQNPIFSEKGLKAAIKVDRSSKTFTAGGRTRWEHPKGSGYVWVNGRVRLADGTEYWAILEISERDSGEHNGTLLFVNGELRDPHDDGIPGKKRDQIWPYSYKYNAQLRCHDHHVGDDGWSR